MEASVATTNYWDMPDPPIYISGFENISGLSVTNTSIVNASYASVEADSNSPVPAYGLVEFLIVSVILGILILLTIIGNVFVIAAIILEKNLQSVANHLILSLAVADLLVAALVMPLSAVYEVTKTWFLGRQVCNMWTSLDVLCCTASILHLVIISLDRYWAITSIDYIHRRTPKRIGLMIVMVWVISAAISIAPLFGWRDPETAHRPNQCLISQDIGYTFFSTFGAFYIPMVVMLTVYFKIYMAAKSRIRKKPGGRAKLPPPSTVCTTQPEVTTMTHLNNASANISPEKSSSTDRAGAANGMAAGSINHIVEPPNIKDQKSQQTEVLIQKVKHKKSTSYDVKKERKAAKTLAIITGSFLLCWLPFFILEVVKPFCHDLELNATMLSVFLWLGYFNSLLNPVIYTIFSPDFRNAFHKILLGRYRKKYYRH